MGVLKDVIYNVKNGLYFNFCSKRWIKEITNGCLVKDNCNVKALLELDDVILKTIVVEWIKNENVVDEVLVTM